ncbi:unnamed protein product [Mucor fragilis]
MKFEKEHKRVNTTAETSSQPLFTKFRFTPALDEYKHAGNQKDTGPPIELHSTRALSVQAPQDQNDDMDAIFVKMETPENYKKLSVVECIPEEYYHYCNLCNTKMPDLTSVLDHFQAVHGIGHFRSSGSFKHMELEPDVHDPNHYCKTCEKTFVSHPKYRQHLIFTHHLRFKPLLVQQTPPNIIEIDPLFCCPLCKTPHPSKDAYDQHLTQHHNVNLSRLSMASNTHVLPDWNDPTLHCPSCNVAFSSKKTFKFHCRNIHFMKSPDKFPNREQGLLPDIHDRNHHCNVCNITLSSKKVFRQHCRYAHGMTLAQSFAFPDLVPDMANPDHYCQTCDKTYSSKPSYHRHVVRVHHMSLARPSTTLHGRLRPNVNDPNFYCRACDKTMRSKHSFKMHLSLMHAIRQQFNKRATRSQANKPDINDPNHYCRVCKKTYASKSSYRSHVGNLHGVQVRHTRDMLLLPDPLDPNFYCRACKHAFKTLRGYRKHCQYAHHMTGRLLDQPFAHPDADIDLSHPQFYCAKCNKYLKCRSSFICHLRVLHAIRIPKKHFDDPNLTATSSSDSSSRARFQCAQCNKHLSSKASLAGHLTKIHRIINTLVGPQVGL